MYLPKHFEAPSTEAMRSLVAQHPFASLVWQSNAGLTAEHVPLLWESDGGEHGTLRGHVARANPVSKEAEGQQVLVMFQGPQHYVTPSWYPSKAESGKVVPTWNYIVVHAHGRLKCRDDGPWIHDLVSRLTESQERPRTTPWAVTDAPEDYVAQMVRAIVGIEIELTQVVGKWKVSQNRSEVDRAGVAKGLKAEAHAAVHVLAGSADAHQVT